MKIVASYIKREQTTSRTVFGDKSTIRKAELLESLQRIVGTKATELEISDTVDFLTASMYENQQYQRTFKNKRDDDQLDVGIIA